MHYSVSYLHFSYQLIWKIIYKIWFPAQCKQDAFSEILALISFKYLQKDMSLFEIEVTINIIDETFIDICV